MEGALASDAPRGFHDAGSAAGRDDIVANAAPRYERTPALGRDSTEAPRFLIPPLRLLGLGWSPPRSKIALGSGVYIVHAPRPQEASS